MTVDLMRTTYKKKEAHGTENRASPPIPFSATMAKCQYDSPFPILSLPFVLRSHRQPNDFFIKIVDPHSRIHDQAGAVHSTGTITDQKRHCICDFLGMGASLRKVSFSL